MSQTVLNDHQACWFIQLTLYDFTIQYHQDSLNSADESSQKPDYMQTEQSERHHKNSSMLINSERHHKSSLKQFQSMSTQNNSSSLISVENKSAWQIDDLISTLVNKFVTAVLETDRQYSCNIRETDSEAESLIWILSLQVMI